MNVELVFFKPTMGAIDSYDFSISGLNSVSPKLTFFTRQNFFELWFRVRVSACVYT